MIERSWTGDLRRVTGCTPDTSLPIAIVIAECDVFVSEVDLPSAASGNIREAIALRLDSVSPIGEADVMIEVNEAEPAGDGRLCVGVAIVRKSTLEELEARFSGSEISSIGAFPQTDGSFLFTFRRKRKDARRSVVAAAAMLAGGLTFLAGLSVHLDRRIAASEAYEASLIRELRFHKEKAAWLTDVEDNRLASQKSAAVVSLLAEIVDELPGRALVQRIDISDGAVTVDGFAPDDAEWPATIAVHLTESLRPGYLAFRAMNDGRGGE
ncbi:MAG: hypothetical protein AB7P23_05480 [Amphiplicatus sp.]